MYELKKKSKIAIIANSKKREWPLGDYIHILSFIPNIPYKSLDWYSNRELFKIVKEVEILNSIKNLNKFNEYKYDHIINLVDEAPNTKKTFYISNLFNKELNQKQNTKSLLENLSKFYNVSNYKIFFNRKKKIKCKYDLFICWHTNENWKIKRYPYKNFIKIKEILEKKHKMKIKIQNKNNSISKYINNIKYSKIILSVMTLGIHFAMIFNKPLVALVGPNNYDDLKLYNNVVEIFPEDNCKFRPCNLPNGVNNCGCMPLIKIENVVKEISRIFQKL